MFLTEKINNLPEDTRLEFYKLVLDNYHCCDDIENLTNEFLFRLIKNGKSTKLSTFIWEIRNND